jgi:hypothetical protein
VKNPTTPEQIVSVCDEVQHLLNTWADGNLEQRDIRAGSNSMRRLLVHNELNKVWNALVGAEKFLIPTAFLKIDHPELVRLYDLYTCSEAKHKGSTIGLAMVYRGKSIMTPMGDGRFKDETKHGVHVESAELSLNQFLDSICMIAEGLEINRNWIVQYVANSLGGAHFGPESKKGPKFDAAMAKLKQFDVGEMPASVRELLAIGEAICRSKSTAILMSAYESWRKDNSSVRIA